jgi:hypothetical protein
MSKTLVRVYLKARMALLKVTAIICVTVQAGQSHENSYPHLHVVVRCKFVHADVGENLRL